MGTTTPRPGDGLGNSPIARAMEAASRDLPAGTAPLAPEAQASSSGPAIPPGELTAEGYRSGDFIFPEPTTVGFQAIVVLTQKLGAQDGSPLDMVTANRMALGVAWISWAIRNGKDEELLDYATGGTVSTAEAARALNAEVPAPKFADYMRAASSYLAWVAKVFTQGTGGPTPPPAGPTGGEAPPSASSS